MQTIDALIENMDGHYNALGDALAADFVQGVQSVLCITWITAVELVGGYGLPVATLLGGYEAGRQWANGIGPVDACIWTPTV